MKNIVASLSALLIWSAVWGQSPQNRLETTLDTILEGHNAFVGIAIRTPEGRMITRNDTLLPMMSVFKLPLALAVLDRAGRDGTPLTHPIVIGPEWLDPNTYSPMRDSLPVAGGTLPLAALLRYCVSQSDNIACDILLDRIGGPHAAEEYVRSLGIEDMHIVATERDMHKTTEKQYLNTARPTAVCELIHRFLSGDSLDEGHRAFLQNLMIETVTGPDKLKAGIPADVAIGHKTGSSDRTQDGVKIADNDAGYVVLPDGRTYCIAVFVTESRESDPTNAGIIATISNAVYSHFTDRR